MLNTIKQWFKKDEPKEPKCEMVSDGVDEHGRIKIELDWNDEFVQLLRENGFTGTTENEVVQKYLQQVAQRMANNVLSQGNFR